ncbi:hypothetical protein GCM10027047_01650 [Rhodococcus aerolatus]
MPRGRNSVYMSPADKKRIAESSAVQRELHRRAVVGARAFRGAAVRRSGDFASHVRVGQRRTPRGVLGYEIVAFPGRPGERRPNAPVPIEFGTRKQRGAHIMRFARAAVKRG